MKRTLLCALILCSGGLFTAHGQEFNKSGRAALQFLKIGIGARQVALGEASIASIRDVNAVFWNPANIAGIGQREASFSYARWFADMNYFAGAAGFRIPNIGIVGVHYASLDYGEMQEALAIGPSNDTRTGNTFTGGDLLVGLSAAREFTDRLSIGATAKYIREKLFTYSADVVAFDVGTNYDVGYNGMRIAMSFQNFGPSVKWIERTEREEGYDIPLVFRLGIAANLVKNAEGFLDAGPDHAVTVSADAVHTNDFGDRMHVGVEYVYADLLALRGGYRFNYEEGNASFGVGLHRALSGLVAHIDYAYVHYTYLASPHRFSLSLDF